MYLEPEDDENVQKCHINSNAVQKQPKNNARMPLQEKSLESFHPVLNANKFLRTNPINLIATTATPRGNIQRQQTSITSKGTIRKIIYLITHKEQY